MVLKTSETPVMSKSVSEDNVDLEEVSEEDSIDSNDMDEEDSDELRDHVTE